MRGAGDSPPCPGVCGEDREEQHSLPFTTPPHWVRGRGSPRSLPSAARDCSGPALASRGPAGADTLRAVSSALPQGLRGPSRSGPQRPGGWSGAGRPSPWSSASRLICSCSVETWGLEPEAAYTPAESGGSHLKAPIRAFESRCFWRGARVSPLIAPGEGLEPGSPLASPCGPGAWNARASLGWIPEPGSCSGHSWGLCFMGRETLKHFGKATVMPFRRTSPPKPKKVRVNS